MKKVAVFDLDGTIYRGALTFAVIEQLLQDDDFKAEREQVDKVRQIWKQRESVESYWVYNKTILKIFGQFAGRVTPEMLENAAKEAFAAKGKHVYAYTYGLLQRLKAEGRVLIAISGSIKDIVNPFAESLGFDIVIGSELEIVDGRYTGKRVSQTNKKKDSLLQGIVEEHGLTLDESIGVGDTHRDVSMLAQVTHPIAFNPNVALYAEAERRGWKIVVERKNMVFEMVKLGDKYMVESAHPSHEGDHQELLQ